jgi:hypothetical protein
MPEASRRRVIAAHSDLRGLLVELWAAVENASSEPPDARERAEQEGAVLAMIQRALGDEWPDGKSRRQLQTVMRGRLHKLAQLGHGSPDAVRKSDPATYQRFLDGCVRAVRRDGLMAAGMLSQAELQVMKSRQLAAERDAQFDDVAEDYTRERYI